MADSHAAAPRSALGNGDSVASRLFRTYYRDGKARPIGASSHWSEFSEHFDVEVDAEGGIVRLAGYGFGESHRTGMAHRVLAQVGIAVQRATLQIAGLGAAVSRGRNMVRARGLDYSLDAFRQTCTARLLSERLDASVFSRRHPDVIMAIGDGHGILSALLHLMYPGAQIWLVDLGPTLVFQAYHLGRAFPDSTHVIAGAPAAGARATFVYCPAEQVNSLLPAKVDLAVNVASMQEMSPEVVANYFSLLRSRRTDVFYCCNRVEKRLPGGELLRFHHYPWLPEDVHLVDEPAPWHQFFVGRGPSPHVRFAGIPIPLMHRYDGMHWHRLTRLAPSA